MADAERSDRVHGAAQLVRFAVVGIVSNLVVLAVFHWLTRAGVRPAIAMTLVYALGVLQTYLFHKRWTFDERQRWSRSLGRYMALHLCCYLVNLMLLSLFVDRLRWNATAVQGGAIVLVAALLFLGQKFWVFRSAPRG